MVEIIRGLATDVGLSDQTNTSKGVGITKRLFTPRGRQKYSDQQLINYVQTAYQELGRVPTLEDMCRPGWPFTSIYTKRKKWSEWVDAAGLPLVHIHRLEDDDLFWNMHKLEVDLGRIPKPSDFNGRVPCYETYARRFGRPWEVVIEKYEHWKGVNRIVPPSSSA